MGLNAATLNCRIRGDNLYWAINGTLLVSSTTSSFRNKGITGSRSMFSGNEVSASLTVNARSGNNNTVVVCKAQAAGQMTVSSDSVSVFIAGMLANMCIQPYRLSGKLCVQKHIPITSCSACASKCVSGTLTTTCMALLLPPSNQAADNIASCSIISVPIATARSLHTCT